VALTASDLLAASDWLVVSAVESVDDPLDPVDSEWLLETEWLVESTEEIPVD
jgi:hypothetical protein